ncbi:MAG: UDP-N-acetylglucosamine 2-epimerase (non-hydrolyzing) [Pyrinomonadaceae bacterium]
MKVMTVFGTRPEIIRLSLIMRVLDQHCDHVTVHTGQNYDDSLSDIFIRDLEIRTPDVNLGIRSKSFADQAAQIISKVDDLFESHHPDRVLLLGDTNSALCAIAAARRQLPVFHLEAGNRCYDDRVPEETNRRIIDHSSAVLMPYTERSKDNLVREGIDRDRIYVTGNPIKEVLDHFSSQIEESPVMASLEVRPFEYFLVTLHRAENVDIPMRLSGILEGLGEISEKFGKPVLVSVHPRTAGKIKELVNISLNPDIRLLKSFGFFDFVKLEKNSLAVLTDSGTVQEECAIFGIPNITLRDVTERPETIECGSNILAGGNSADMVRAVEIAIAQPASWVAPREYLTPNVSQTVSKVVLGYTSFRRHSS